MLKDDNYCGFRQTNMGSIEFVLGLVTSLSPISRFRLMVAKCLAFSYPKKRYFYH